MQKEKIVYLGLAIIIAVMLLLDGSFSFTDKKTSLIYNLGDLKLTQIDLPCEVYITYGDNQKLVLEASEEAVERLEINENNGILSIRNKNVDHIFGFINRKFNLPGKIKIYINHSELDRIIVNNQATIISVDYKPVDFQSNSLAEKSEKKYRTYFSIASLGSIKQYIMKSIIQRTIFRIYSSV